MRRGSRAIVGIAPLAAICAFASACASADGAGSRPNRSLRAVAPIAELRIAAKRATPPPAYPQLAESAPADPLPSELLDLSIVAPGVQIDLRYASEHNFLGEPIYENARALAQRPAAEALARAHAALRKLGFGIRVLDAYRPWWVTKLFWDAVPEDQRIFVSDPARGSRHNRGCALDVTLFDLLTREEVEMPSEFDEASERSHPDYAGGTAEQRRKRDLLRSAMEFEGFEVYPVEWWHFDYKDWRRYPVMNFDFTEIH